MISLNKCLRAALGAGFVALIFAPAPSHAFTPNVAREWTHFVQCLDLLITDGPAHKAQCSPSRVPPNFKSLLEPTIGAVVPVPPVVKPEPKPEPKPDCIPDLPCKPGCLPDFPCPPKNLG